MPEERNNPVPMAPPSFAAQNVPVAGQTQDDKPHPLTLLADATAVLHQITHDRGEPAWLVGTARDGLMALTRLCYGQAKAGGWWTNLETGEPKNRNDGEMFMLQVSEISEAMEGHRKNKDDEHLPHRKSVEVELADALIRIFDYAGGRGLDLAGALVEKLAYNAMRADHKVENRKLDDGKKY